MESTPTKSLTQVELAAALGFSQPRISKLLKRGMPRDVDAAEKWLSENAERSVGGQSARRQAKQQLACPPPPMPSESEIAADGMEGLKARVRATEHACYDLMRAAFEAKNNGMLGILARSHALAVRSRVDAEKRIAAHEREFSDLVPLSEAEDAVSRALEPLAAQLDNFPRSVAAAANPTAPAVAEKAIATALDSIRRQIAAMLERAETAATPADQPQSTAA